MVGGPGIGTIRSQPVLSANTGDLWIFSTNSDTSISDFEDIWSGDGVPPVPRAQGVLGGTSFHGGWSRVWNNTKVAAALQISAIYE